MATKFIRHEGKYNIYEFDCPVCEVFGETRVKDDSHKLFAHGCGLLFIQRLPRGMFAQPKLEEIIPSQGGQA